jgi:hypothetical protein
MPLSPLCTDRGGHYPHSVVANGVVDQCEGYQPNRVTEQTTNAEIAALYAGDPADVFARVMDVTDPACGTTGCEAHDGECRKEGV